MTKIKIDKFDGLSPSVEPRNLAPTGAQVATNLDMRFDDFRPARGLGAALTAVAAGTKSIFKTPSGVWLTSTTDTDYVNSQLNDADVERVYLTGRSAYPEVWQDGTYRQLGVPAPTSKPLTSLQVNDEFDQTDASAAQEAAATEIVEAVESTYSTQLYGNPAAGGGGSGTGYDPLYSKVQLHLDFQDYTGTTFHDLSPQKRAITKETGVSQGTDTLGPLGAAGGNYGVFAGGSGVGGLVFSEIRRWGTEADRTWTVDMKLTPTETLAELILEQWRGAGDDLANPNLRKLILVTAGGAYRSMMSNINGSFNTALRCKRPGGANIATAGVPVLISVQNTGNATEVYVDGVLCGSTYHLGLEFSHFARAVNDPNEAFLGKVDELRVTFAARYSGNFTPPTTPYPTIAVPTGNIVAHGDVSYTGLPTSSAEDAAYVFQLTLSGGSYVAANPADEYLRALPGAQVTGPGPAQYWAVLLPNYRATGVTTTEGAILTAIDAAESPPGTDILTTPEATTLAALIYDLYDVGVEPFKGLVGAINSAQADLITQLSAPGSTATLVQNKLTLLASASAAVESYFATLPTEIRTILRENEPALFGDIVADVVTREVSTRAYLITYVTDRGEESAPSPVSDLITLDQNDYVQVTAPTPPAGRFIAGWRLYRSITTNQSAAFSLVVDDAAANAVMDGTTFLYYDINNLSFLDSVVDAELQEECPSLTWAEPPADMIGLVGLPNGIMAGFFGKTVCFSEPYRPHAWPLEYQSSVKYDVIGLGVFGQTLVVLTKGHPYYASGADSASMSLQEIEVPQSCIGKRTIVPVEGGVMFVSPDGLCLAGPSGVEVLTYTAFSKEDWQEVANSGSLGAYSDGNYYLFTGD